MPLNNILRLEEGLLIMPRPLGPPLPHADTLSQRMPVYDENRRLIPHMFRDVRTGRISYEPPTPLKTNPKTKSKIRNDFWIDARTTRPERPGAYRTTTSANPITSKIYVRWFDGRDWFGPGVTLVRLCENPLHIRKWDKVNDVCWWQPLTLEQNEQLINAGVLDEFVRHFN